MFPLKSSERRPWTEAEDGALKHIYESLQHNKWSLIAQQLQIYGFPGRTGKQCRQRYNNQLDPKVCHEEWVFEQQMRLYKLHDELGNKWAVISHRLGGGRTDNSVKNHYYSRLRKSLRKLNKIIHAKHKKIFREVQTKVLYKMIEASEERFKAEPMVDPEYSQWGCKLKNKILIFSYEEDEEGGLSNQDQVAVDLVKQINQFNRNYKRKPKRFRKLGAPNIDMLDSIDSEEVRHRKEHQTEQNQNQNENMAGSNFSLPPLKCSFQDQQEAEVKVVQQKKFITPIILTSRSKLEEKVQEKMKESANMNMVGSGPQILFDMGLLQDYADMPPHPLLTRRATSQMSSDHQQSHQEWKAFQDSSVDMRLMAPPLLSTIHKRQSENQEELFR